MTPEEKFMFDLQGYLVVKNVLSQEEVDELNEIADQKLANQEEVNDGLKIPRKVSLWGRPFQNLFDHPNIAPYLANSSAPNFGPITTTASLCEKAATKARFTGAITERVTTGTNIETT